LVVSIFNVLIVFSVFENIWGGEIMFSICKSYSGLCHCLIDMYFVSVRVREGARAC